MEKLDAPYARPDDLGHKVGGRRKGGVFGGKHLAATPSSSGSSLTGSGTGCTQLMASCGQPLGSSQPKASSAAPMETVQVWYQRAKVMACSGGRLARLLILSVT
jgi:hypothetical protein